MKHYLQELIEDKQQTPVGYAIFFSLAKSLAILTIWILIVYGLYWIGKPR